MAIENVELMHEYTPEHLRMGIARMKIKQRNGEIGQENTSENEKNYIGHEKSPYGLTIARPTVSRRSLLPEALEALPNEPNLHL